MSKPPQRTAGDAWQHLRRYTDARIALGHAGGSLPTAAALAFAAAHAEARDAIHVVLPAAALARDIAALGVVTHAVRSAAQDRTQFLLRPDLGRRLDATAALELAAVAPAAGCDLVLVVADGLSALAVERHALPLLQALLGELAQLRLNPLVVIAQQARVALGDAIAVALHARMVAVIIGERPGLSAADSLGIYFTYAPAVPTQDARRNCISNIRGGGLGYAAAAARLRWLIEQARLRQLSGVELKDDAIAALTGADAHLAQGNFLLPP